MKFKFAVLMGRENAGKTWTLKKFAKEVCKANHATFHRFVSPVYEMAELDARALGFSLDAENAENWDLLRQCAKDVVVAGECRGKKVLIISEGDFRWSWLVLLKRIQDKFPDVAEEDEVLVFCACRMNSAEEYHEIRERGIDLASCRQIAFAQIEVRLVQLEYQEICKTKVNYRQDNEERACDELFALFQEWVVGRDPGVQDCAKEV